MSADIYCPDPKAHEQPAPSRLAALEAVADRAQQVYIAAHGAQDWHGLGAALDALSSAPPAPQPTEQGAPAADATAAEVRIPKASAQWPCDPGSPEGRAYRLCRMWERNGVDVGSITAQVNLEDEIRAAESALRARLAEAERERDEALDLLRQGDECNWCFEEGAGLPPRIASFIGKAAPLPSPPPGDGVVEAERDALRGALIRFVHGAEPDPETAREADRVIAFIDAYLLARLAAAEKVVEAAWAYVDRRPWLRNQGMTGVNQEGSGAALCDALATLRAASDKEKK